MKKYMIHPYEISYQELQERRHEEFMEKAGRALLLTLGIVIGIVLSRLL